MNEGKLNPVALGYAAAIFSAVIMLLLGIGKNIGVYAGATEQMQRWHMFFSFSLGGIIAGIIEAAVHSFILGLFFGWLYNSFAK
jgi:hypothetical protein